MKFAYDVPVGAVCDYVDKALTVVIKDEWNQAQKQALDSGLVLMLASPMGIPTLLVEGGPLDTCDVYFNPAICDQKEDLFQQVCLNVRVVLIDLDNEIVFDHSHTLSKEQSARFYKECQMLIPESFDVNVDGLLSSYEPSELGKFAWCQCQL